MPEEQKEEDKKKSASESFDELRGKIQKKESVDTKEIIRQIATRDILEQDYKQDILGVVFQSAPGVNRKIKARKPTPKQMADITRLSVEAAIYESETPNPKLATKISGIYEKLSEFATELSVDEELNKEFWFERISQTTLASFMGQLITTVQQGPLTEAELRSFVESGLASMEYRLCELLHKTPSEIGEIRRERPLDIIFLERHILWEAEERHKQQKELERKSKIKKPHKGRIGR